MIRFNRSEIGPKMAGAMGQRTSRRDSRVGRVAVGRTDLGEGKRNALVGGAGEESRQTVRREQESRKFVRGVIMLLNERAKVVSCAVMRSARAGEDRGRTEELGS